MAHDRPGALGAYSLGIHAADLAGRLSQHGAVRIVGFRRSGKSTLAEMLAREFAESERDVLHQTASRWLGDRPYLLGHAAGDATVDPEIALALGRLEGKEHATWIVDDADVLGAYASEEILGELGRRIRAGVLSVVLIRNRFVLEGGWMRHRESLLSPSMPTLYLDGLDDHDADAICASMFAGDHRAEQASWLADFSGGVPGLISELAPLAAAIADDQRQRALDSRVDAMRRELRLDHPERAQVLSALRSRTLPPLSLLTPQCASEVGTLMAAGMVRFRYWQEASAFRGRFWELVAGAERPAAGDSLDELERIGLALEALIRQSGLHDPMLSALELQDGSEGTLAIAFSQVLYWSQRSETLAPSLREVLAESLGAVHLRSILAGRQGSRAGRTDGPHELAGQLIDVASER